MGQAQRKAEVRYSYRDYRDWPSNERWELINGTAWNMSPAPNRAHQTVLGRLYLIFATWLAGKPCQVYLAPFDVLFPADPTQSDDDVDTVVQPDLSVFCHPERLTAAGARGAPDLIVEILSPWTSKKDLNDKFALYQAQAVREYWVVDPAGSLQLYRLDAAGRYADPLILEGSGVATSALLAGLQVDVGELFAPYQP